MKSNFPPFKVSMMLRNSMKSSVVVIACCLHCYKPGEALPSAKPEIQPIVKSIAYSILGSISSSTQTWPPQDQLITSTKTSTVTGRIFIIFIIILYNYIIFSQKLFFKSNAQKVSKAMNTFILQISRRFSFGMNRVLHQTKSFHPNEKLFRNLFLLNFDK